MMPLCKTTRFFTNLLLLQRRVHPCAVMRAHAGEFVRRRGEARPPIASWVALYDTRYIITSELSQQPAHGFDKGTHKKMAHRTVQNKTVAVNIANLKGKNTRTSIGL